MTDERFDDFQRLDTVSRISVAPAGGWRVLWKPWRTVVMLAALPGVFTINMSIAAWTFTPLAVALIAMISAVQALIIATFLPRPDQALVTTCGAIPPLTLFAASILLADLPKDASMGFMALVIVGVGAVLRFFGTTCKV